MEIPSTHRFHAFVSGIVQGVGFRYFVYEVGIYLHLNGWVRNRLTGKVEILSEGPKKELELLIKEVRKGPKMAQVEDVHIEWSEPKGDLPPFTILYTK